MNTHYHPYSELASPHPPSPDNNNFGGGGGGGGGGVVGGVVGGGGHGIQHHHNGHGPPGMGMDGQQGFHQMNNNNGTIKHCAGCGGKIVERFFLHALDRYWHNSCLKCSCCGAMLADIGSSCYTRNSMILCKADYSRMFRNSGACSACGLSIPATEFVMRTTSQMSGAAVGMAGNQTSGQTPPGPGGGGGGNGVGGGGGGVGGVGGGQLQHHVFHLKCFACSKCGSHLRPGDRYYMLAGSLVCEQDWHKLIKSSAATAAVGVAGTPPLRKGKVGRPRRSRD